MHAYIHCSCKTWLHRIKTKQNINRCKLTENDLCKATLTHSDLLDRFFSRNVNINLSRLLASASRFEKSGEISVEKHRIFSRFNDFSSVVKFLKTFARKKL